MHLICLMTSQDNLTEGSCEFMVGGSIQCVTTLTRFVTIDIMIVGIYCFQFVTGPHVTTCLKGYVDIWVESPDGMSPPHHVSFNCNLTAPQPTLGHYRKGSLTHLMLITVILHIWPKGYQEPFVKVGP